MLATILPGVRDVRTPLVAGILWVFLVWLWVGPSIDRATRGNGTIERIDALVGWVPTGAAVAILSLTAYLIGSLLTVERMPWMLLRRLWSAWQQSSSWLHRRESLGWLLYGKRTRSIRAGIGRMNPWRQEDYSKSEGGWVVTEQMARADTELMAWARRAADGVAPGVLLRDISEGGVRVRISEKKSHFLGEGGGEPFWGAPAQGNDFLVLALADAVEEELNRGTLVFLLHVANPPVFDDVDRARSEAELRFSIALPLMLISITLGSLASWWVLLGVPAAGWLLWAGVQAQRKWRNFTITALAHDLISSPTAQRVQETEPEAVE